MNNHQLYLLSLVFLTPILGDEQMTSPSVVLPEDVPQYNLILKENIINLPETSLQISVIGNQVFNKKLGIGSLVTLLGYEWDLNKNNIFLNVEAGLGKSNLTFLFDGLFGQFNIGFHYFFYKPHGISINLGMKTNLSEGKLNTINGFGALYYSYKFSPTIRGSIGLFAEVHISEKLTINEITQDEINILDHSNNYNEEDIHKLQNNLTSRLIFAQAIPNFEIAQELLEVEKSEHKPKLQKSEEYYQKKGFNIEQLKKELEQDKGLEEFKRQLLNKIEMHKTTLLDYVKNVVPIRNILEQEAQKIASEQAKLYSLNSNIRKNSPSAEEKYQIKKSFIVSTISNTFLQDMADILRNKRLQLNENPNLIDTVIITNKNHKEWQITSGICLKLQYKFLPSNNYILENLEIIRTS